MNRFAPVLLALLLVGCATNRSRTLLGMALAGGAGSGAGYAAAPKEESPAGHALLWGGVSAAVMGALGLFLFDEQHRAQELTRENEVLKRTLDGLTGKEDTGRLVVDTQSPFGKDVPQEYRGLIKPGRWSVYALDHWTLQGENTLIHQDKMVRLIPPELSPRGQSELTTGEKK